MRLSRVKGGIVELREVSCQRNAMGAHYVKLHRRRGMLGESEVERERERAREVEQSHERILLRNVTS